MLDLKVPCVVRDIDELDASIVADVENAHRRDVSAFERAEGIARILKMNPDMSQDELARRLAERPATISNLISLAAWPEEVLAAYGSPHNVLLKDSERLAPSLRERTDKERDARDAVIARAKQVAAEQVRRAELNDDPIPRTEVTERLLRAGVGEVRRSLEIVDHRDNVIVALKRSRGSQLEVVVHGDGRPTPTVQAAFAQLLQEHRAKRSGRVPLKTEKPTEVRNAA
jgi:ParB-like chromosome segregation protein Spo0J